MEETRIGSLSLVITSEELRTAPREVRQWLQRLIGAPDPTNLVFERNGFRYTDETLAILDEAETLAVLECIADDFVATQVLFQFGSDCYDPATGVQHAHVVSAADIARYTEIHSPATIPDYLNRIEQSVRDLRGDQTASLFRRHAHGRYSVHESTQVAIHRVWEKLMKAQGPAAKAIGAPRAALAAPIAEPNRLLATTDGLAAEPSLLSLP